MHPHVPIGLCAVTLLICSGAAVVAYSIRRSNGASAPELDRAYILGHLIDCGESREFNEWGAMQPARSTKDLLAVRQRADEALVVLREKIKSDEAGIRFNAYEFLVDLLQVPSVRHQASSLLHESLANETPDLRPPLRNLIGNAFSRSMPASLQSPTASLSGQRPSQE